MIAKIVQTAKQMVKASVLSPSARCWSARLTPSIPAMLSSVPP